MPVKSPAIFLLCVCVCISQEVNYYICQKVKNVKWLEQITDVMQTQLGYDMRNFSSCDVAAKINSHLSRYYEQNHT